MSLSLLALQQYCHQLLNVSAFKDYCPNGLQIQSSDDDQLIKKLVTGVTACEALIDQAIERNADAIIVHHGYFWKGESQALTGMKGRRIRKLMQNNISLLAYHLPLDAHPQLGNNMQLAQRLEIDITGGLDDGDFPIGNIGELKKMQTLSQFSEVIHTALNRAPLVIGDEQRPLKRIAWCTGAAQSYLEKAADQGVDCFISGEISEPTVHIARELDIAYIAAGHHATERYGVKALGEHLQQQFTVDVEFVDIDNPV